MAKKIDLYYMEMSAPCRSVLMVAHGLKIDLNKIPTNLMDGEHLKPEFLKMNPQHTVPTMDDNGFYLSESREILKYLVNAYGKNDFLYPKDPKKRYLIDNRLAFDQGTLYPRYGELYYPVIFGAPAFDEEKKKKFEEALGWLDGFLKKTAFIAGNDLTIADAALASTLAQIEAVHHDFSPYPRLKQYMTKLKEEICGYAELNQRGADQFGEWANKAGLAKVRG